MGPIPTLGSHLLCMNEPSADLKLPPAPSVLENRGVKYYIGSHKIPETEFPLIERMGQDLEYLVGYHNSFEFDREESGETLARDISRLENELVNPELNPRERAKFEKRLDQTRGLQEFYTLHGWRFTQDIVRSLELI